jgi:hypothetical protein
MASTAQIAANHINAQSSSGPRTAAGKLASSRNAVTHSLAAKMFFLSENDKPVFEELRDALVTHYKPATDHERTLVEEYAEAKWRCRTARIMEASFFQIVVKEQRQADPTLTDEHAVSRVFVDDTLQKRLRLVMRYLNAAERSVEKARLELERVIAIRREQEALEAEMEFTCAREQRIHEMNTTSAGARTGIPELVQNEPNSPPSR